MTVMDLRSKPDLVPLTETDRDWSADVVAVHSCYVGHCHPVVSADPEAWTPGPPGPERIVVCSCVLPAACADCKGRLA